ncbi:helix-turn-helix transcriptional regulator [Paenibacillus cisolokensis]|uniref:helix-turn-helix domain-containing protein n=1 Tax=Paenibacillus cisolokensis TaxID=1658519 RepID=UPI003D2C020B
MAFEDTIDQIPVQRADFHLSADNPIVVFDDTYLDSRSFLFDMHYDLEIGIVYSGKMVRKYQSHEVELGPGEVWLCGFWEPHGFRLSEVPCEVFSFVFSPEILVNALQPEFNWFELFSLPPEKRLQIPEERRGDILQICDKLRVIRNSKTEIDMLWKKLWILEILLYLSQERPDTASLKKSTETRAYHGIQPSLRLVLQSKKLVSTQDAAKACLMSTSQFSRLFHNLMGISFSKFALRHRVKEAARQLIATDDTIKEIAAEWGFTDTSHFHNCFVSHFSVSPKEYRKLHKPGKHG